MNLVFKRINFANQKKINGTIYYLFTFHSRIIIIFLNWQKYIEASKLFKKKRRSNKKELRLQTPMWRRNKNKTTPQYTTPKD
jgi:hypothetical protein